MEEKFTYHMFMPQETVKAIVRKYNNQESDPSTINTLMDRFYEMNGRQVFKPGMKVKIPLK